MSRRYQAPTVRKAFQILALVAKSEAGLTLSQLSRTLGISKSTVHGITKALEEAGAVVRDPETRRFTPGLILFELARAARAPAELKILARPLLRELMEQTQETVCLGVRSGDRVVIVDSVESDSDLKIAAPVGTRIPLLAGAVGKVFLAALPADQVTRLVTEAELKPYTARAITQAAHYLEEIDRVRRRGYATDDEEYLAGVRAVASPIRAEGQPLSAIWVVGFSASMTAEKIESVARQTRAVAEAIGRRAVATTAHTE